MLGFNISGVVLDGPSTELLGLSAVRFVNFNGEWSVVVASEADSSLSSFGFANNTLTGVIDYQGYNSLTGTRAVWDLTVIEMGGDTVVLPATRYEDHTEVYRIEAGATIGVGVNPTGFGQLSANTALTIGGDTYVYTSGSGGAGIEAYEAVSRYTFNQVDQEQNSASVHLGDVSALATATVGSQAYLFVASAYDAGVTSYGIASNGALNFADSVSPSDFSGFWKVQDLATTEVDGQDFLIMASAGTSSLTVYSVSQDGTLSETDHMIDSLGTRFQGASIVEAFEHDGRSFVIAAGNDDGISILEISDEGQLWEHASLADTYETTLANVTGISVEEINGSLEVLVSSATDHGFTHITLDLSQIETNPFALRCIGYFGVAPNAGGSAGAAFYSRNWNEQDEFVFVEGNTDTTEAVFSPAFEANTQQEVQQNLTSEEVFFSPLSEMLVLQFEDHI
jgi:hypothetical protein